MKQKIISTSKAEILVVDLPEDARNLELSYFSYQKQCYTDDYILIFDSKDRKGLRGTDRPHLVLPKGNWQSLIFDEETANKIVQHKKYCITALKSLQSLIDANVRIKNHLIKPSSMDGILNRNEGYQRALKEWQEAEESVFHNPHYFFKLL